MWIEALFSHKCKNHQIVRYICNFPDSKRAAIKESLSNSKPSTDSKSPKTMKVLYPEETAFGSTSEISLREISGTAATTCVHVLGFFFYTGKFILYNKNLF